MKLTAYGPLMDALGMAHKRSHLRSRSGALETRHRLWATPSAQVRRVQSSHIGVDINHSREWIGQVRHLERDAGGRLWCVAEISASFDPPEEIPLYFSPALTFDKGDGSDVEITSVGIVEATAMVGSLPISFLPGDLSHRAAPQRWTSSQLDYSRRPLLTRAAATAAGRRYSDPLTVHDETWAEPLRMPGGRAYLVDEELVPASERTGAMVHDDEGRPLGAMRYSSPFSGVLTVR